MAATDNMLFSSYPSAARPDLANHCKVEAYLRLYDRLSSPLGPSTEWSSSLRTIIHLCLDSEFPLVLFWGPDFVMLYNDAYISMLTDKHPAALGRPVREVWPEVWSLIGPMLQGVRETGQATWSYDLPLHLVQNGTKAERYFTFSFSPIRNADGQICGVFCPVTETTARVHSERSAQRLQAEAEAALDQVTHILESMTDHFVTLDREWRFTYVNSAAAQFVSHRAADMLGKNCWEQFPSLRGTLIETEFRRAMTERVTVGFEAFAPWGRWIEVRVFPLKESGISVFFRDITERKRDEEAQLRLAAIVESSDDAIVSKSLDGVVTSWNAAAERIFGYRAEEMIGHSIRRLLPEDRQEEENVILARLQRGERVDHFETVRRTKDGRLLNVSVTISPLRDKHGRIIGASKIARDFTAHKEIEAKLAAQTAELQRVNAELQQFAYVVSHDLSEPLRTMRTYVQFLEQRLRGTLDQASTEEMAFITDAAERMQHMLKDLLAYTRVGGEQVVWSLVDCNLVLSQVLDDLQVAIQESCAVVTQDPLPTLQGDTSRLKQVLQNLISNAVKFRSYAPPRIHISAQRQGGYWQFAVRDNGIGIDPKHFGRLFQVFRRLHTRREYPGTGIGLAICKKIVEQHGGRMWVESVLGKGATFFFTLRDCP